MVFRMFHYVGSVKILWIFCSILVSICFGVLDYEANLKLKLKSLKAELTNAEQTVFEYVVKDFENILDDCNSNKLRFLKNLEIVQKPMQNTQIKIEEDNGLFRIVTNDKKIIFSLRDTKDNIGALVFKEIDFNVATQALKTADGLKHSLALIPESLYFNYGINDGYLKDIRNYFLIHAIIKTTIICGIMITLNIIFLVFYNSNKNKALSHEIHGLKGDLFKITAINTSICAENKILKLIFDKNEDYLSISMLCEIFKNYFSDKDTKVDFECHISGKDNNTLNIELAIILLSIIFYRKALSSGIWLKIGIFVEKNKLKILIQDNGFKLLRGGKVVTYTERINKPSFILEWDQIFGILQENNISYKVSNTDELNLITITATLNKQYKNSNICYLKDFR